ncbi:MAG: carbon starvation CstA family protein [Tidjanibacter sp.]|nr:carbon starvation CstA family protein [Tidjanibacter sp.]
MVTFLICLTLLVVAYFTYGRYLERIAGIRNTLEVPSKTLYDGVDYLPLPRWKIFLIQLLNIAGLGPIFGALLGAAYGPVAFVWITAGGILFGAMHDFLSGVISLRNGGQSLPEIVGKYLGSKTKLVMRIFSVFLMIMVGAVFMSQPAELIADRITSPLLDTVAFVTPAGNTFSWLLLIVLGVILVYYVVATLLPIDKIIGKIYPIFGSLLLFMALSMLYVILTRYMGAIPEFTGFQNMKADAARSPIIPMLFTTIACGAISGFHATQSPLMARCMKNENQSRTVFYGAMISESIIALIWAAIAMVFWGNVEGLNDAIAQYGGKAAVLVDRISTATIGRTLSYFVIFGVVACAITSGDTAFRSARLIVADFMGIEQKSLSKRLWVCLPIFILGLIIIFLLPFGSMWSYFAWANQVMAVFTLWTITVYLKSVKRPLWISLVPALFMTYICSCYIFVSPLMFGMGATVAAYVAGGVVAIAISLFMMTKVFGYAKKHA